MRFKEGDRARVTDKVRPFLKYLIGEEVTIKRIYHRSVLIHVSKSEERIVFKKALTHITYQPYLI